MIFSSYVTDRQTHTQSNEILKVLVNMPCEDVVLILLIISGMYIGAWPRVVRSLNDKPIISLLPPVRLLRLPKPEAERIGSG